MIRDREETLRPRGCTASNAGDRVSRLSFFFSSRRRHTRWNCDWSSDVCSSDLLLGRERPLNPVSRASHSAQLLGDLVLAVCAGNSFTGGNATAHEGEGSHRDCSQRGCGRERLPAVYKKSQDRKSVV